MREARTMSPIRRADEAGGREKPSVAFFELSARRESTAALRVCLAANLGRPRWGAVIRWDFPILSIVWPQVNDRLLRPLDLLSRSDYTG